MTFGPARSVDPGPDCVEEAKRIALAGTPVRLERLREWPEGSLRAMAEFLVGTPALEAPVEPFASAFERLLPGESSGSLREAHGEAVPRRFDWGSPCATCEAWKGCRGYWRDGGASGERCAEWREAMSVLAAAAARAIRSSG